MSSALIAGRVQFDSKPTPTTTGTIQHIVFIMWLLVSSDSSRNYDKKSPLRCLRKKT